MSRHILKLTSAGLSVPEVLFFVLLVSSTIASSFFALNSYFRFSASRQAKEVILQMRDNFYASDKLPATSPQTLTLLLEPAQTKSVAPKGIPKGVDINYFLNFSADFGEVTLMGVRYQSGDVLYRWSDLAGRRRLQAISLKDANRER